MTAWHCKVNPKFNSFREAKIADTYCLYTFKCLNYKENYAANNNKCLFWHHCFDKQ